MNAIVVPSEKKCLQLELPAEPASVGKVRQAVTHFAGRCGLTDTWPVRQAVSEAVGNVVQHAYPERTEDATVRIAAECDAEQLLVRVEDQGHGMLPRLDSPGLGLGISLMKALTARLLVEDRPQGGLRIELRFAL